MGESGEALLVTLTMWRTPALVAAATTASSWAGIAGETRITTSTSASAASRLASSSRSPRAISTPASRKSLILAGSRARTRAGVPALAKSVAASRPTLPGVVIRIIESLHVSRACSAGRLPGRGNSFRRSAITNKDRIRHRPITLSDQCGRPLSSASCGSSSPSPRSCTSPVQPNGCTCPNRASARPSERLRQRRVAPYLSAQAAMLRSPAGRTNAR